MPRLPRTVLRPRVAVAGVAALFAMVLSLVLAAAPAGASTTDNAQISLTGLVDDNHPTGGSQLGIHPGDSIRFTASAAPTAKVQSLANSIGLGSVLDNLLGGSTKFRVTADFSRLPGGSANTVLSGSTSKTFHFPSKGTYQITWTADSVGLLGTTPIQLDGNQAKQAGVTLNAENHYVGQIVVATNPPTGIGVQLPSIAAQPTIAGIPLPKVPGIHPSIPVAVPNLNPTKPRKIAKPPAKGPVNRRIDLGRDGPLPVPAQILDQAGGYSGGGSSGGGYQAINGSGPLGNYGTLTGTGNKSSGAAKAAGNGTSAADTKAAQRASLAVSQQPSAQLPIVLAIIAVIALSLVAATYARMYLLRRES